MTMVLRAIEIEADCILGAKAIDGVYDSDPAVNPNAKKYDELPISKIVDDRLGVIDLGCKCSCNGKQNANVIVCLNEEDSINKAVSGEKIGTKLQ